MLWIPDNGIKVNDAVIGAASPDPLVDRLPHFLLLGIIKGLQWRSSKRILKGCQGGANDFDAMEMRPINQLLITSDDLFRGDRFFRRRQKSSGPSNVVDAFHDDHVGDAWLAQHVAVQPGQCLYP